MIVALFILRVASLVSCLVLCECATSEVTSTLVNCNEVGCQLPHRTLISRSSCLKKPGERNDVLELAFVCKMCRPPLGEPLQFSVSVSHRWCHLQYSQDSSFSMSVAFVYCF